MGSREICSTVGIDRFTYSAGEEVTDENHEMVETYEISESLYDEHSVHAGHEGINSCGSCKGDDHVKKVEDAKGELHVVSSYAEMKELINDYSVRTECRFVVSRKAKNFGLPSLECDLVGHQVQWHDMRRTGAITNVIHFDGIPHIFVGDYQMHCEFGVDNHVLKKEKRKKLKEEGILNVKSRVHKNPTKKCGCPVKIYAKQVIKFPEFKINGNTEWKKKEGARKLRERLKICRKDLLSEVLIIMKLPHVTEHKFHKIMKGGYLSREGVHSDLVFKTQELCLQIQSYEEISKHLKDYVSNEMFWQQQLPSSASRKYYPSSRDISNIITRFRQCCKINEDELKSIQNLIEEIKSESDNVKIQFESDQKRKKESKGSPVDDLKEESYRNEEEKEKKFHMVMLTYQNKFQQRLIKRFSNVFFIAEIEGYKAPKKIIPYRMYSLLVQTNVDYQVVGCIVVSKLKGGNLSDGLSLFKEWNPSWKPKYIFVDCSQQIYDAVESAFPDSTYFLNPSSCEKKWYEFVSTKSNDLEGDCKEILTYLRNIQYSFSEEGLKLTASALESSDIWKKNEKLRTWFQTSWLLLAKKWVFGYRPEDLLLMQHLKYSITDCIQVYAEVLSDCGKRNGLLDMIRKIACDISLLESTKYVKRNNESYLFNEQFTKKISVFECLQGLPSAIVPYLYGVSQIAMVNSFTILVDSTGMFTVQVFNNESDGELGNHRNDDVITSKITGEIEIADTHFGSVEYSNDLCSGNYIVSFGDSSSYPFCTCPHWLFYKLPCVHMFAVFNNMSGWKYDMLSPLYRFNPVIHTDSSYLNYSIPLQICDRACQFQSNDTPSDADSEYIGGYIFEFPQNVLATHFLIEQIKQFTKNFQKMRFLFRKKKLFAKMLSELEDIYARLKTCSIENTRNSKNSCFLSNKLNIVNPVGFKSLTQSANLKINVKDGDTASLVRNVMKNKLDTPISANLSSPSIKACLVAKESSAMISDAVMKTETRRTIIEEEVENLEVAVSPPPCFPSSEQPVVITSIESGFLPIRAIPSNETVHLKEPVKELSIPNELVSGKMKGVFVKGKISLAAARDIMIATSSVAKYDNGKNLFSKNTSEDRKQTPDLDNTISFSMKRKMVPSKIHKNDVKAYEAETIGVMKERNKSDEMSDIDFCSSEPYKRNKFLNNISPHKIGNG